MNISRDFWVLVERITGNVSAGQSLFGDLGSRVMAI